jgi:hypothetical protein
MPCRGFLDMQHCMHFADNWEEEGGEVWDEKFVGKKVESPIEVANHCQNYVVVEDACNV